LQSAMTAQPKEDGFTILELCTAAGKSYRNERSMREAMRALISAERAECVRVMRPRLNGVMATTFGYRLK
jgi:hypothetical protein